MKVEVVEIDLATKRATDGPYVVEVEGDQFNENVAKDAQEEAWGSFCGGTYRYDAPMGVWFVSSDDKQFQMKQVH